MNEQRSLHHSQSKVVCRNFSGLELLKHWKICVAYRQWRSDFRRRRRKPKYGKKPKVTYSVALVMAFFAAGNKNRRLEDLPQADFGRVPEWFPIWVRTKSITENFVFWKLCLLFIFMLFQRIFSFWALAPTHFTIFIRGLSILLFSFIN